MGKSKKSSLNSKITDPYSTYAEELSKRYLSVPSILEDWGTLSFPQTDDFPILDIGAGSGRELAWLIRHGYTASGIEASPAMIQQALIAYPHIKEHLFQGRFPDLLIDFSWPAHLPGEGGWAGIVCCALIQHIPDNQLFDFFFGALRLLRANGRLLISYPTEHEENTRTYTDEFERVYYLRHPQQYESIFLQLGFMNINSANSADNMGRAHTSWNTEIWQAPHY